MEELKPMVWVSIRTTDVAPEIDQIVQFYAIKRIPNQKNPEILDLKICPTIFIPLEKEVSLEENLPTFKDVAQQIIDFMEGCHIGAWDSDYVLGKIAQEFQDIWGSDFQYNTDGNIHFFDGEKIHKKYNPHDLKSVYESSFFTKLASFDQAKEGAEAGLMMYNNMIKLYGLENHTPKDMGVESFYPDKENVFISTSERLPLVNMEVLAKLHKTECLTDFTCVLHYLSKPEKNLQTGFYFKNPFLGNDTDFLQYIDPKQFIVTSWREVPFKEEMYYYEDSDGTNDGE